MRVQLSACIFVSFCIFIGIFCFLPKTIFATGQSIKIMSFNTEPSGNALTGAGLNAAKCGKNKSKITSFSLDKANKLALYIKNNSIEVAMFQEIYNRCDGAVYENIAISQALTLIGYPMYYINVPYVDPYGTFHHAATYSRYPIDTAGTIFFPLNDGHGRYSLMTPIQTEVGVVHFYNIHTNYTGSCAGVIGAFNQYELDPFPYKIMGGDFNATLTNNPCGKDITSKYELNI